MAWEVNEREGGWGWRPSFTKFAAEAQRGRQLYLEEPGAREESFHWEGFRCGMRQQTVGKLQDQGVGADHFRSESPGEVNLLAHL